MLCASTEIHIMPDWTVGIELAVFLVTAAVLTFFVFRPTLRIIDRRRAFTSDASVEAGQLTIDAEQLELGRREALAMALREAHAEAETRVAEVRREADAIVVRARSRAAEVQKVSAAEIAATETVPAKELEARARDLATAIVGRVTGGSSA